MKFLFDLLPVLLFFAAYKFAGGSPDASHALATRLLGDGIAVSQAPILIATAVAIVATLGQVFWLIARGRKVDTMLWISLAIIVVFGGATLFFHDATFIKWKPTVLYWLFALTLAGSALFMKRNLIRALMKDQVQLPEPVWARLNLSWIAFFAVMGILNLYVAYSYSEDTWVSFKLYGGMGLMFLFVLGQGLMLSRHIEEKNS
ncbi:intracellular septation protein [Methyloversatilis universalis FAM5]|uniref:Inner membrane-spanning protein YciB n=1 Tax=Methyloversatilis universalis (strain ATCC BAA-1314 / DSM 25237 / JCM 13912 / CCUG 52030 / FAM5) TaxID=1000565 RepID=F5R9F2_METUF|nr:septation protein A [Methyloversatilis universalis]EGK73022.1 intracellular septation protein [Methyloversatilis universalis FAM5]